MPCANTAPSSRRKTARPRHRDLVRRHRLRGGRRRGPRARLGGLVAARGAPSLRRRSAGDRLARASRNWPAVSREALAAGLAPADIDLVAATRGPGLVGALLVGLSIGSAMAFALGRPFLRRPPPRGAPLVALPARRRARAGAARTLRGPGGLGRPHAAVEVVDGGDAATLAETRDDAMGEVFDKLGKRLGLPYPGSAGRRAGRERRRAAHPCRCRPSATSLFFSYSGLKSAALLDLERLAKACSRSRTASAAARPTVLPMRRRAAAAGARSARRASAPPPWGSSSTACPPPRAQRPIGRSPSPAASPPTACCAASSCLGGSARRRPPSGAARLRGDNAAMIALAALLRTVAASPAIPGRVEAESRIPLESR